MPFPELPGIVFYPTCQSPNKHDWRDHPVQPENIGGLTQQYCSKCGMVTLVSPNPIDPSKDQHERRSS